MIVDSLENLRKVAVQRLEIEFAAPVDAGEFRSLPGVTEAQAEGATVIVGFEGSADAVVKTAAAHEVRAIRPREDDLEDIFLRYYRAEDPAVSWPTTGIALRLRLPATVVGVLGLIAVMIAVGALFPAVGHSIGKLHVPSERRQPVGRRGLRHDHRLVPQRDRHLSTARS